MAVGLHAANLANLWLGTLAAAGSIASGAARADFIQPHTADPGAAGTTAVFTSVSTQRSQATYGTASAGSIGLTGTLPEWSVTGSGTVSHISAWNQSATGSFRFSATLTTSKAVANGDTLRLTSLTVSLTPIASA